MVIDGGKGHLSVVKEVMQEQQIFVPFVCMSKGPDRHAGLEQFHLPDNPPFTLDKNLPVMKYLQIIRDEVHNFAIKSHRNKRDKNITVSSLDNIQAIGKVRKKALLNHFGSYKAISEASIDEMTKVQNISRKIAEIIFKHLHNNSI